MTRKQHTGLLSLRRSLAALVSADTRTALRRVRCDLVSRWLSRVSLPLTANARPAIVFAPHQDDETLGCGGMIALKRALGAAVTVVFVTDGGSSHLGDPETPPAELIRLRRQEALTALRALRIEDAHFLDRPDSGLRSLSPEERQRLIGEICHLLRENRPDEVYVPHRADVHEDHEETYALVKSAIRQAGIRPRVYQYSIWMLWWRNTPFIDMKRAEVAGAHRLPLGKALCSKLQALAVYHSQEAILTSGFLRRFHRPEEIFFAPPHEKD